MHWFQVIIHTYLLRICLVWFLGFGFIYFSLDKFHKDSHEGVYKLSFGTRLGGRRQLMGLLGVYAFLGIFSCSHSYIINCPTGCWRLSNSGVNLCAFFFSRISFEELRQYFSLAFASLLTFLLFRMYMSLFWWFDSIGAQSIRSLVRPGHLSTFHFLIL